MASPQLEKGYMRLAHEITEALVKTSLSDEQLKTILHVLRITYGYQKKETMAPIKAFHKIKTKNSIKEILNQLRELYIINLEWVGIDTCLISFNKDFEKWKC